MDREQAVKMKNTVHPDFKITVDEGGKLVDILGVRHKGANPMDGSDLPQVSSFLFDSQGKVIWLKISENWRIRPDPQEILDAAKAAFSK
jgi:peroxiredoxin